MDFGLISTAYMKTDYKFLHILEPRCRGINYQHILFVSAHNNIKSTEHSFTKPVTIDADSTGWHRLCDASVNQEQSMNCIWR